MTSEGAGSLSTRTVGAAEAPRFAFRGKVHVIWPSRLATGQSWAQNITLRRMVHVDRNVTNAQLILTLLHEMMHIWNYDHNRGTNNWLAGFANFRHGEHAGEPEHRLPRGVRRVLRLGAQARPVGRTEAGSAQPSVAGAGARAGEPRHGRAQLDRSDDRAPAADRQGPLRAHLRACQRHAGQRSGWPALAVPAVPALAAAH